MQETNHGADYQRKYELGQVETLGAFNPYDNAKPVVGVPKENRSRNLRKANNRRAILALPEKASSNTFSEGMTSNSLLVSEPSREYQGGDTLIKKSNSSSHLGENNTTEELHELVNK